MLGEGERRHRQSVGQLARAGRPARTPARPRADRFWRKSLAGVLCGGLTGFLLGAAFWIVLGLQEIAVSGAPRFAPAREPQGVQAPQCTSLALDRRKGRTTAEPCLGQVLPLREASAAAAGDRSLP